MDSIVWIASWVLSIGLLLIATWIAALNWSVVWRGLIRRQRTSSWIPLLAGALGTVGVLLLPLEGAARFWWIPWIADWGCAPGLLFTMVGSLFGSRRRQ